MNYRAINAALKLFEKKMSRHLACILCSAQALLCSLSFVSSASGQASIIPLLQEVSVTRGGKARFQLRIANRESEALHFTMQAYNLAVSEEGMPSPMLEESGWSCATWVAFTPNAFELQAGGVQIIDGLIEAPKDALGGHYAFITSEFTIPAETFDIGKNQRSKASFEFSGAVSSLLLVSVKSSKNHVQLEPDNPVFLSGRESSLETMPELSTAEQGVGWQVILPVENTGNIHTVAQGEVSLWTEDVRLVEKKELSAGRGYVLPGKRRLFRAYGSKLLDDGVYMVKVRIRSREGKLVQGSFPYSIINGRPIQGAATEAIRDLLEASAPLFSLSKRILDFRIAPRAKRTKGIRLTNHTSDSLSVFARTVTWSLDDSGKVIFNPSGWQQTKPCNSWMTVSPNPIRLPPERSAAAKITLTAPVDIEGEYYGGVIFQATEDIQDLPAELQLARTLLVLASSAEGLEYKAEVTSFYCQPISSMMRGFVVKVGNKGNVHCFASGKLELYDQDWNLAMKPISFGGSQDYILPARDRAYLVPCPGALEPGTYEAVVSVKYHEEEAPAVAKVKFQQ